MSCTSVSRCNLAIYTCQPVPHHLPHGNLPPPQVSLVSERLAERRYDKVARLLKRYKHAHAVGGAPPPQR